MTPHIQADLVARGLHPDIHLVDAGYVDAQNLATSTHQMGIDLVGPTHPDTSWQARQPNGFDIMQFHIDWQAQVAICPAGQTSEVWAEGRSEFGASVIRVNFPAKICRDCPWHERCTTGEKRGLTLRPQLEHEALFLARQREQTPEFKTLYRQRAGVEGTFSQTLRVTGLRQSRYLGLAKSHLHCVLAATAINLIRAINWLNNVPLLTKRLSHLAALAA